MGSHRIQHPAARVTIVLTMEPPAQPDPPEPQEQLAPEDFYFDGPYLVFTAAYHLKRGFCCNNDCRHCPYK